MASNFPDTSVNNPETGVPWVDGDTWFDSSSDYTYIWYSPVWRTGEASGSDFVKVAGDNMIGDLTLGTDKITLEATSGAATFAGTVWSNGGTATNYAFLATGDINTAKGIGVFNAGGVNVAEINLDGAAEFAGDVTMGDGTTEAKFLVAGRTSPRLAMKGNVTGSSVAYYQDQATNDVKWQLDGDGSATFKGAVSSGAFTNGSATSPGAPGVFYNNSDTQSALYARNYGESKGFIIESKSGANNVALQVTNTSGTDMISLYGNGNSFFRGAASFASSINASSAISVNRGTDDDSAAFTVQNSTGVVSRLNCNGSSQFNARLTGGVSTLNDRAIVGANNTPAGGGGTITAFNYNGSGEVWNGFAVGVRTSVILADGTFSGKNVTFNLEADDDTKYTSTTNSEGVETRVYNGAVLDVKDRIQNVLTRMDAIEANEITDDATDSALLTLIASLSARLDERDTAIAALTARVSTLES
tara:strand:- start:12 stop:1430 length:1419 start_codon:yes stop_codon:yes gene_type:complete